MGSTSSFLGFSCPNLLSVFLNLLVFRNLLHIMTTEIRLFALKSKKEKLLDRVQNGF